jgi:hypothetical protein
MFIDNDELKEDESIFEHVCRCYGLDHNKASFLDLASAKEGHPLTLKEVEDLHGKNWTSWACR